MSADRAPASPFTTKTTMPVAMAPRERLAAACMVVLVAATCLRLPWPSDGLLALACAALLGFMAAAWPGVGRQGRVFVVLGAVASGAAFLFSDAGTTVLAGAGAQSVQFATLLAALATLRLPMRRSGLIARAAACLVATGARRRYAALSFGSHLLSLIFSFGVVPMMGEMLRRSGLDARTSPGARQMLMAVIRGLSMTTAWSPMAISFAIVSTALPQMRPLAFMGAGLVAATLVLAGGCLLHRPLPLAPQTPADAPRGDVRSLFIILGMASALFGATLLLYQLSGLPFIMASALTLPCFSLLWLALERDPAPTVGPGLASRFFQVLTEMRSETFIFSASTFIGQAIVAIVLAHADRLGTAWQGLLTPLPLALLCVWLIPAIAMLSIAPTIVVLLLAQAVAHSGFGLATPVTFACALTLGWSLAIGISPVSATLLIAGAITGVPPREIAFGWNLRYTLGASVAAAAFVGLLYAMGW